MSAVSNVTLFRTVNLRAIVTDDLKKFLIFEFDEQIKSLQNQLPAIDAKLTHLLGQNQSLPPDQQTQLRSLAERDKQNLQVQIDQIRVNIDSVKNMPLDTLYDQGTIQSLVTVKPGDNLYNKLGAGEIIIKDGIIVEIKFPGEEPITK